MLTCTSCNQGVQYVKAPVGETTFDDSRDTSLFLIRRHSNWEIYYDCDINKPVSFFSPLLIAWADGRILFYDSNADSEFSYFFACIDRTQITQVKNKILSQFKIEDKNTDFMMISPDAEYTIMSLQGENILFSISLTEDAIKEFSSSLNIDHDSSILFNGKSWDRKIFLDAWNKSVTKILSLSNSIDYNNAISVKAEINDGMIYVLDTNGDILFEQNINLHE